MGSAMNIFNTSNLEQVGNQHNYLRLSGLVEENPVHGPGKEVGDAECGEGKSIQPLFPAFAPQVVPHRGYDDAVLNPSREEEHGYGCSRSPFLDSHAATAAISGRHSLDPTALLTLQMIFDLYTTTRWVRARARVQGYEWFKGYYNDLLW